MSCHSHSTPVVGALSFFVFVAMLIPSANAQDLFPDKNLEAVVRQSVFAKRDNKEPLNEKDVENISIVHGRGKGISNLQGLEKCRSLAELDLSDNAITDVSPIKDLKNIQSLSLGKNQIADVGPLAELVKLQLLDLSDNQVTAIDALAKLENMRTLYLTNNKLEKIETLTKLTKIWTLYLDGNPVKDLAPVGSLPNLSSLSLRNMQLENIDAIKPLKELHSLYLQNNKLTDLSLLIEMAKQDAAGDQNFAMFWRIYLAGNPLSEQAKTAQFEELKKIGSRIFLDSDQTQAN
jgi:Leucine-rich repeat (LRR) protein